jgi:hypothetical protein
VQSLLAFVLYILVMVALIGLGYGLYRRKSGIFGAAKPDQLGEEIVTGLMSELRKSEAEAAYWKTIAERLQREADER